MPADKTSATLVQPLLSDYYTLRDGGLGVDDRARESRPRTDRVIDAPLAVNLVRAPGAISAGTTDFLVETLVGSATAWGPRIPVSVTYLIDGTPSAPVVRGDKTLVAVLVDFDMVDPTSERHDENLRFLDALVGEGRSGSMGVLPIAIGPVLNDLPSGLAGINFKRVEPGDDDEIALHIIIGCLRVLNNEPAVPIRVESIPPAFESSRVAVFLSHAKADYKSHARATVDALLESDRRYGIETWFDAAQIQPGQDFQLRLEAELRRCDVVLAVLSDAYSDREWCRREFFVAKSFDRPIVVVDALQEGSPRLFPYIGNVPIVRWEARVVDTTDRNQDAARDLDRMRLSVVLQTLKQALTCQFNTRVLEGLASGARVLATAPELLTLPKPASTGTVIYPDPPLSRDEEAELESRYDNLDLVTPLTLMGLAAAPGTKIALSISDCDPDPESGSTSAHLGAFWNDVNLALLRCGYRVVYGGMLGYSRTSEVNFAVRLAELAFSHAPLLQRLDTKGLIDNLRAWPNQLTDDDRKRLGSFFKTHRDAPPPDLPAEVLTHRRPYASAVALTDMRTKSTQGSRARVSAGGKLSGYSGLVPGVVEELYLSLQAGQPTYLVGLGGGATRCVIDLLNGRDRPELSSWWCREYVPGWVEIEDGYQTYQDEFVGPEATRDYFLSMEPNRWEHPSFRNNGLTSDETRELEQTVDVRRAVTLVIRGLAQLGLERAASAATPVTTDVLRTSPRDHGKD